MTYKCAVFTLIQCENKYALYFDEYYQCVGLHANWQLPFSGGSRGFMGVTRRGYRFFFFGGGGG